MTPDPRYPIGRFHHEGPVTDEQYEAWLTDMSALPADFRAAVEGMSDAQLETPYREGGWTVRQVIHHVPDSHLNGYVRTKLALTEDAPTIKPYEEKEWAKLGDLRAVPVETNLRFLELIHEKWVAVLRTLDHAQRARTFVHPVNGVTRLDWNVGHYAWHGRHHLAHVLRAPGVGV